MNNEKITNIFQIFSLKFDHIFVNFFSFLNFKYFSFSFSPIITHPNLVLSSIFFIFVRITVFLLRFFLTSQMRSKLVLVDPHLVGIAQEDGVLQDVFLGDVFLV